MVGQKRKKENLLPELDEGWWESVLEEESRASSFVSNHPGEGRLPLGGESERNSTEKKVTANWTQVKDLYMRDQIIDLTVIGHNRGGLLVEGNGLSGFVPFSHLVELAGKAEATERDHELGEYLGRSLRLKVIECVPEDGRVVFSERAAQAVPGKRAELFHALQPGQRIQGVVTNITDFGVFIDLGGVEGLIHISELSWGRVTHPSQIVAMGSTMGVLVLDLAPERCRVALSLKRLQPNPWQSAAQEFPEGSIKKAEITSVLSYGAFARLESGVEGLIHVSEIPQAHGKPLREVLSNRQEVMVRIIHLDAVHQRLGLSMNIKHAP